MVKHLNGGPISRGVEMKRPAADRKCRFLHGHGLSKPVGANSRAT